MAQHKILQSWMLDAAGDEAAAEPAPDQLEIHRGNVLHIVKDVKSVEQTELSLIDFQIVLYYDAAAHSLYP